MTLNFKTLLITSVLALSPLMAADDDQPAQEEVPLVTAPQTVMIAFSKKKGNIFRREVRLCNDLLYMPDNKLTGPIPMTIGLLSNLKRLCFSNNQFAGPIPKTIEGLKNLEELFINNNQLTGPIPECMWSLPKLHSINFHGNPLFGQEILINGREIQLNTFFVVTRNEDGLSVITVFNHELDFDSYLTNDGVWQKKLIKSYDKFDNFTFSLQAILIAELANYGYEQKMIFTFPGNRGTLTIHPAENGLPRGIETSKGAQLGELVEALNKLHMLLDKYYECSLNSEHPVGLIYIEKGKSTKNARNVAN